MKNEYVNEISINTEEFFTEIMDRLKTAGGIQKNSALAEYLGISPTAFSNRKKTGSVPYEQLIEVAYKNGISFNWLFTGQPPMMIDDAMEEVDIYDAATDSGGYMAEKPVDQEALETAIECVELYINELNLIVSSGKKAKVIRMLYPLICDEEELPQDDKIIDLLKLAAEDERDNNNENEQTRMVKSHKSKG